VPQEDHRAGKAGGREGDSAAFAVAGRGQAFEGAQEVAHEVAGDVADVSAASQSALPSAQISAPLGDVGAMDGIGRQEDLDTSLAAKV